MFQSYLKLGFEHILDPNGLDHVLFIMVLSVPFLLKDWKKVVLLATAFTIGHSITLALASMSILKIGSSFIELLIAVTILITAGLNIIEIGKKRIGLRYPAAAIFGLIHGMGFSNFFRTVLGNDEIVMPLLAFNLGVELAQIVIVLITLILGYLWVNVLKWQQRNWILGISVVVIFWSVKMIVERI